MFKNKLIILTPVIAFVAFFIFSLTLLPSTKMQVRDLPVAIVNEDEGITLPSGEEMNMGDTIVAKLRTAMSENDEAPMEFTILNSRKKLDKALDEQEFYGALVIPKDFSANQATLQTEDPVSPELEIVVNQGMNASASQIINQGLSTMVDNVNVMMSTQISESLIAKDITVSPERAKIISSPITKTVTLAHPVGENTANGNMPVSLFQPLWMATLAAAAILFLQTRNLPVRSVKESMYIKLGQILVGFISACVVGFGFAWIADAMVGLNIPDYSDTAVYLTISSLSFFLMITALLCLVGYAGLAICGLMLFFGAPLLSMAPEMMPQFYQDWVYPWLPMRFMTEGLRELFFFNDGLSWSSSLTSLVCIGIASIIIILGTGVKVGLKASVEEETTTEMDNTLEDSPSIEEVNDDIEDSYPSRMKAKAVQENPNLIVNSIPDVVTTTETIEETIVFQTMTQNTLSLPKGQTDLIITGVNGIQEKTYEKTYVKGVLTATKLIDSEVIQEPITEFILIGTQEVVPARLTKEQAIEVLASSSAMSVAEQNGVIVYELNHDMTRTLHVEIDSNGVSYVEYDPYMYNSAEGLSIEQLMEKYDYTNKLATLIYTSAKMADPQITESVQLVSEAIYGVGTRKSKELYDEMMSTPKSYKYVEKYND